MNILILFIVSLIVLLVIRGIGRALIERSEKVRSFYETNPKRYILLERVIYIVITLGIYFLFIVEWKEFKNGY